MRFYDIIPDYKILLELEPEEIGGVVLEYLSNMPDNSGSFSRYNFGLDYNVKEYPLEQREKISKVLMEGWMWLEREGLIAPNPGSQGDWGFITRRGLQIKNREGLKSYKKGDLLPRHLLHPQIVQKIWSAYIRGDYDIAIFQSFKEVEIAVREKSGLPKELIGVQLMRQAFDIKKGKLTNINADKGEQEAVQHLFAGAIGSYKNPQSHRNVSIIDPIEAVEMIMLASHLLKIVDSKENNS